MSKEFRNFDRRISDGIIADLLKEPLYTDRLLPDIIRPPSEPRAGVQRVFPAIREDRIDFYHRGGKLFSYDKRGFRTNLKYATSFANANELTAEIRESDLAKVVRIPNFSEGYESIKTLCALYAGSEAKGVSGLYSRYPFGVGSSRVVVLDIEASFDARTRDDSENDQDRIDVVLFDTHKRLLMFVEAKRYLNPEIYAPEESAAPVVAQIARYRDQLALQKDNVISAYRRYVRGMNALLGLHLPEPEAVVPIVPLLIFDFDGPQKPRVKTCKEAISRHGVRCLSKGTLPPKDGSTLVKWFALTSDGYS